MTHHNEFQDPPEVCAARAADPAWQAEQVAKREAAAQAYADRRAEVKMSLTQKGAGERF